MNFENRLKRYNFTIDDVYNIKEEFLRKIILNESRNNLNVKLDNIIKNYFSKKHDNDLVQENEVFKLVGNSYSYYDSMQYGKNLNKPRKRKKHKKNHDHNVFIPIVSEELGSDDSYDYEEKIDIEKEILGDY